MIKEENFRKSSLTRIQQLSRQKTGWKIANEAENVCAMARHGARRYSHFDSGYRRGGLGCKKASDVLARELEKDYPCREIVLGDTSKPGILIIGDSISIGYTPFVRAALPGFDVLHNPCNALNSAVTLDLLDRWLAIRDRWFAIVFNVGLWDIMKSTSVYPNEYKRNLEEIALKLEKASPNVLFALTTAVPAHAPGRRNSEVVFYNSIARKVMARQHIAIIDLYGASVRLADHHIDPESQTDVHFDKMGYEELARPVAAALKHLPPM